MCDGNCTTFLNQSPVTLYVAAFYTDKGGSYATVGVCPGNSSVVLDTRGYQVMASADPIEQSTLDYDGLNAAQTLYTNAVICTDEQGTQSKQITLQNGTATTITLSTVKQSSDQNYLATITLSCGSSCGPDVTMPTDRLKQPTYNRAQPGNSSVVKNVGNVPLYLASYYHEAKDYWFVLGFVFPGKSAFLPIRPNYVLISVKPILETSYDALVPVVIDTYGSSAVQVGVQSDAKRSAKNTVELPDGTKNVPLSASVAPGSDYSAVITAGADSPAAGPTSGTVPNTSGDGPNDSGLTKPSKGLSHTAIIVIIAVSVVVGLIVLYAIFSSNGSDNRSTYRYEPPPRAYYYPQYPPSY